MKKIMFIIIVLSIFSLIHCNSPKENKDLNLSVSDSLPQILPGNHDDLIYNRIKNEAAIKFSTNQLPCNLKDWELYKADLKNEIIQKTGIKINHELALNMKETNSIQMSGYTVKNIIFQSQKDIYATANLYVPEGEGPFPGVIVLSGHSINGRLGSSQTLGYGLALNGYVAMTIDPWGAGERTTEYGSFEYHGANLGASLMNIGESLMGLHITDNMRGVDLLCALPYVDSEKIGATGASGGGNQTMWLAALDERVRAAVPVVSVGTFESYVMGHNCICETLIDGLTFTEESGILGLIAPRALLISNGLKDSNTAFYPSEMLRSFHNAMPVYEMYNAGHKLKHLIFDGPHSYPQVTRDAMLHLFNIYLKELEDSPIVTVKDERLPEEKIMNFPTGMRNKGVISTAEYCINRGNELRENFLSIRSFNNNQKKEELRNILKVKQESEFKELHHFPGENGWDRFGLETSDGKLIPILHLSPGTESEGYVIMSHPDGKKNIPYSYIKQMHAKGKGIVIVDLSGTGEVTSFRSEGYDKKVKLHTLARAQLWLGKTVIGEWVKELDAVNQFLHANFKAHKVEIAGYRESGIAGLFLSVLEGNVDNVVLQNSPVSYRFDKRESIDYFSMGIHLPGFLNWGDISLAAALSGNNVEFINPVTMSGQKINDSKLKEFKQEFENLRKICKSKGEIHFTEPTNY